jgi:hypothetical protein
MKTKLISIISIILFLLTMSACTNKGKNPELTVENITRAVSNLGAIDCYYHGIAKIYRPKDGAFKKDTTHWYDFAAEVKLGIDLSQVVIEKTTISETEESVVIKLPPIIQLSAPEILTDTINTISSDNGRRSAKISSNDVTEVFDQARKKIQEELMQDSGLKKNAENRVKNILEAYIKNLGEIDGKTYTIKWEKLTETPSTNTEVATENS